jgi:hypothetical protein
MKIKDLVKKRKNHIVMKMEGGRRESRQERVNEANN